MKRALPLIGAITLSACGGNGDEGGDVIDPVTYVEFSDASSTETSTISGHQLASSTVSTINGELVRINNRATLNGVTGSINADRTVISIDGGGTITLDDLATAYVTSFAAQPSVGAPSIGVIGIASETSDIPSTGTVSIYTSASGSSVQIIDGTSVYDLSGSITANVTFSSNDVDLVFDDLDGTRSTGTAAPVAVTDVATITIDNATISGNVFVGGTATFNSAQIASTLSGSEAVVTSGGFYGPDADEVAGVFVIDDRTGATLLIQGTFVAD